MCFHEFNANGARTTVYTHADVFAKFMLVHTNTKLANKEYMQPALHIVTIVGYKLVMHIDVTHVKFYCSLEFAYAIKNMRMRLKD